MSEEKKPISEERERRKKVRKNVLLPGQLHEAAMDGHRHLRRRQLLQRHVRLHAGTHGFQVAEPLEPLGQWLSTFLASRHPYLVRCINI